jgi:ketosteroid isomerase-like protein
MTEAEKYRLATTFIAGLRARDASLLGSVLTENVVWSIPGSSVVSGEAKGVRGIIERVNHFAERSLKIEILHVVYGYTDVALLLHNTGNHDGRILDEYLTTVCHLEGGRIGRLDTMISDVKMLENYFA